MHIFGKADVEYMFIWKFYINTGALFCIGAAAKMILISCRGQFFSLENDHKPQIGCQIYSIKPPVIFNMSM